MISLRKRYANWRNARASTGPRTAKGKARAAQNARKHGLRVPALRDPEMAKDIGELARRLAGPAADAQQFEAACRMVAAQIDLLRIRQARLPLLARVSVDRTAVARLTTFDRYEGDARSRRKLAMRALGGAPASVCASSGEAPGAEGRVEDFDTAALLRQMASRKTARSSPRGAARSSSDGRGTAFAPRPKTAVSYGFTVRSRA